MSDPVGPPFQDYTSRGFAAQVFSASWEDKKPYLRERIVQGLGNVESLDALNEQYKPSAFKMALCMQFADSTVLIAALHQRFVYEGDWAYFCLWARLVLSGHVDGDFVKSFMPKARMYGAPSEEKTSDDEDEELGRRPPPIRSVISGSKAKNLDVPGLVISTSPGHHLTPVPPHLQERSLELDQEQVSLPMHHPSPSTPCAPPDLLIAPQNRIVPGAASQTGRPGVPRSEPVSSVDSPHAKFFVSLLEGDASICCGFLSFLFPFFADERMASWLLAAPHAGDFLSRSIVNIEPRFALLIESYVHAFAAPNPLEPCCDEACARLFRPHDVFLALVGWCNLVNVQGDLCVILNHNRSFQKGTTHPRHGDSYICLEFGNSFESAAFALTRLALASTDGKRKMEIQVRAQAAIEGLNQRNAQAVTSVKYDPMIERVVSIFEKFHSEARGQWILHGRGGKPSYHSVAAFVPPSSASNHTRDWHIDQSYYGGRQVDLTGHATVLYCLRVLGKQSSLHDISIIITTDRARRYIFGGRSESSTNSEPDKSCEWKRIPGAIWGMKGDELFNSCVPSTCKFLPCGSSSMILLHYRFLIRLSLATGVVEWKIALPVKAMCWRDSTQSTIIVWILLGEHSQVHGLAEINAQTGELSALRAMPLPFEDSGTDRYGERIWCLQDKTIFVSTSAYRGSGRSLWKVDSHGPVVWRVPIQDDSIVSIAEPWVAVSHSADYHNGKIVIYRASTHDMVRTINVGGITRLKRLVWLPHSLVVVHGGQYEKSISSFDLDSGQERWRIETKFSDAAKPMHGDVDGNSSESKYPIQCGESLTFLASKKGGLFVETLQGQVEDCVVWPREGDIICKSSSTSGGAVACVSACKLQIAMPKRPLRTLIDDRVKGILAVVGRYALLSIDIIYPGGTAVCVSINPFLDHCYKAAIAILGIKRYNRSTRILGANGMDVMRQIASWIWKTRHNTAWTQIP